MKINRVTSMERKRHCAGFINPERTFMAIPLLILTAILLPLAKRSGSGWAFLVPGILGAIAIGLVATDFVQFQVFRRGRPKPSKKRKG